jgi:23S rRNA pseudouridine1911/1915/1917 synthase
MSALQFLYDDGDIFAVYKPAGVHSVRLANGKGAASIVDLLLEHNPSLVQAGKAPEDGGLVHRLDASTSGVLVGAATRKSWELLFALVLSGALKKHYVP